MQRDFMKLTLGKKDTSSLDHFPDMRKSKMMKLPRNIYQQLGNMYQTTHSTFIRTKKEYICIQDYGKNGPGKENKARHKNILKGMRDSWRLEQGVEKLFYIHQKQNKVTISNIKKYAKGWETVKDWNIHQKQIIK